MVRREIEIHYERITNSPIADIAVVWAKDDNNDIRGFIVERGMKGFSTPKIEGKLSLRSSDTGIATDLHDSIRNDNVGRCASSRNKLTSSCERIERPIWMFE